ncbi:MAG: 30S ribosomal protein S18 [Candidatus Spechtbacterales bacterium]|nr:30S ribosomal protein S18 [Candidatus Spechtbacterales bacterium]
MRECRVCKNQIDINWKDAEFLGNFLDNNHKILSPRKTGTCAKHQRGIAKAIKRARQMGVLPYTPMISR